MLSSKVPREDSSWMPALLLEPCSLHLWSSVSHGVFIVGFSTGVGNPDWFQLKSLHSIKPANILLNKIMSIGCGCLSRGQHPTHCRNSNGFLLCNPWTTMECGCLSLSYTLYQRHPQRTWVTLHDGTCQSTSTWNNSPICHWSSLTLLRRVGTYPIPANMPWLPLAMYEELMAQCLWILHQPMAIMGLFTL